MKPRRKPKVKKPKVEDEPPEKEERRPGDDQPASELFFGPEKPETQEGPATSTSGQYQCNDEGFYGDQNDCNKFYRCVAGLNGLEAVSFNCPPGLVWDEKATTCNWPAAVASCLNPNGPREVGSSNTNEQQPPASTRSSNQRQAQKIKCDRDGFFRNPNNCHKFIRCSEGKTFKFDCPAGLVFNESLEICDWESEENTCS